MHAECQICNAEVLYSASVSYEYCTVILYKLLEDRVPRTVEINFHHREIIRYLNSNFAYDMILLLL